MNIRFTTVASISKSPLNGKEQILEVKENIKNYFQQHAIKAQWKSPVVQTIKIFWLPLTCSFIFLNLFYLR